MRAVQAGAAPAVLVAAADVRLAAPESELEGVLGDGAAALTIADRDVIAEFVDAASVAEEFTYVWRTDAQRTAAGRRRPLLQHLWIRPRCRRGDPSAARAPASRAEGRSTSWRSTRPTRAPRPTWRSRSASIRKTQLVESLQPRDRLHRLGRAAAAARRAPSTAPQPGQRILVAGYGEGADALLFRATDALADAPRRDRRWRRWLAAKTPLASYEKYLKFRRLIEVEEATDVVTNVLEFKELKQDVRLYGSRCRDCGQVQYPMARVCIQLPGAGAPRRRPHRRAAARCSPSRSTT